MVGVMANDYSFPADDYVLIGKITKAHGLRGEVKVFPFSEDPSNLVLYKVLVLVDRSGFLSPPLTVARSRVQGKTAVIQFTEMNDRTRAEASEGMGVLLALDDLPEIDGNEYYWQDYVGKLVVDRNGKEIGKVDHLFSNGAQDILAVRGNGNEILIPVTRDIVVEENSGSLVIDPPPGLLELNSDAD